MTHKRFNNLLISIICFLLCILILSTAARAEDDWSWMAQAGAKANFARADEVEFHPAIYGTLKASSGSGYENPGYGLTGEIQARYKWAEIKGYGSYNWEHKKGADSGNTYNIGTYLRLGYNLFGPMHLRKLYLFPDVLSDAKINDWTGTP